MGQFGEGSFERDPSEWRVFFPDRTTPGEVVHYVKANDSKFLLGFRVKVQTLSNIPSVIKVLKGSEVVDVPNIILTLDPCFCCTER